MEWYLGAWRKSTDYSGRARRREYWMFAAVNSVIIFALNIVGMFLGFESLGLLYALVAVVPSLALTVRRLHDTNRSGWWLLLYLIPVFGALVLLIFMCLDSYPRDNAWGPNPKAPTIAATAAISPGITGSQ